MDGSDAFGQGVEIGDGDPFDGTDFGDFGGPEPAGSDPEAPTVTSELKTVDKEGNEIGEAPAHAPADAASAESQTGEAAQSNTEGESPAVQTEPAAIAENTQPQAGGHERSAEERETEARAYREERGEPHPRPFDVPSTHQMAGAERPRPTPQGAAAPDPQPAEPQTPGASDGPTEAERREQEGDAPEGDPTAASSTASESANASELSEPVGSAELESGASDEEAEPPEEPTDSSGKTTKRRYVVLKVVGPGKFEQVTWYEKDGEIVPKGPGAKRQGIALARGAEDALKIGYVACGAPQDGVNLVAVAQLHFQPKPVRPAAPKPSAVRLQIG